MRIALRLAAFGVLLSPAAALAQAADCSPPATWPQVHPELPSAEQPARRLPIGSYTLAITWAPEYCYAHGRDPDADFECGRHPHFGFVLHGLWPDGVGKDWPQYCAATPLLPPAIIRGAMCATPSAQLLQHEWAKHGTCIAGATPASYFARSTGLYAKLRYPDMTGLATSRQPLTAGRLADMMASANPGMRADMMRITTKQGSWLDEIWICLDKAFAYTRCPAHSGGVAPETMLKVGRGRGG